MRDDAGNKSPAVKGDGFPHVRFSGNQCGRQQQKKHNAEHGAQTAMSSENPKSEIRNPREARNPKSEKPARAKASLRISVFGFLSDFGIRISDLFHLTQLQFWFSIAHPRTIRRR